MQRDSDKHTGRHTHRQTYAETNWPSADETAAAVLLEDDDDDDDSGACCLELAPGVTLSLLVGVITLDTGVLDLSYYIQRL